VGYKKIETQEKARGRCKIGRSPKMNDVTHDFRRRGK
jgi:hypothetical protein